MIKKQEKHTTEFKMSTCRASKSNCQGDKMIGNLMACYYWVAVLLYSKTLLYRMLSGQSA